MGWGVRWFLLGCAALGGAGLLAGCGGFMFAEREPWRHEAEVACLNSGAVKEGAGIVRIEPIRGPGICGADFPLKVSVLGESAPLGYADELRPPAAIPDGAATPRWPLAKPGYAPPPEPARPRSGAEPRSLDPPLPERANGGAPGYDFRRPYDAPPSPPIDRAPLRAPSPRDDFSPQPYERRPLVDAPPIARGAPGGIDRAPLRAPARADAARVREPPVVPLAPAPEPQPAGLVPVAVSPPATLACPLVSELERWIASAVQPAALRWFGVPVAEITQISAYSCRGMNGNPRASISEHAFGNALDIAAFTLADGRRITVKSGWNGLPEEQGFLRDVQGSACDLFTTVLAPGSNAYHDDHIHVDLMRRSSGHRACNPHAVSGAEVAARAGARYAARRGGGPLITGAIPPRQLPSRHLRSDAGDENRRVRALPIAEPGEDGAED